MGFLKLGTRPYFCGVYKVMIDFINRTELLSLFIQI